MAKFSLLRSLYSLVLLINLVGCDRGREWELTWSDEFTYIGKPDGAFWGDSITSASINTKNKVEFLYGRIEVSAKITSALGSWPAIWLLGTNISDVGWPDCGEIDIMENVGFDPDKIHANIHTASYNHVLGTNKGSYIEVRDPWKDFHVYALEWSADRMDFFFDDSLYFS